MKERASLDRAPRAWNERFTNFLPTIGFTVSYTDPSHFVKHQDASKVFLLLYVDDIIITGTCEHLISAVKLALQEEFDMKDLSHLHYFLGIEITYLQNGLFVSQHKYAQDLLHKSGLADCHTHCTPCKSGLKLLKTAGSPLQSHDVLQFRSIVGCLQYLTFTRPDIAFAVNSVCQFLHCPTDEYLIAARRILRYVKSTMNHGIMYKRGEYTDLPQLQAFCDAD
ncbi:uncharacterized mitochondrial protein AtMg00810-like [Rosa chinensis]|uniref:uncharacterized mitochondrial protein AtMg00810-like n=1 Tax=Rosa chinensis TaxID=74649 RepID=UPI000D08A3B6|nr:uncharacterized mitochondrial protein AtMg00810-like [Rosa chinensis]